MNIKCYFSIHEIHNNSQKIYSNNFNSNDRTRIIISNADLFDIDTNTKIGKIFEKTTKIMDNTHSTFVEFYLFFDNYGKITITDFFCLNNINPFHSNFTFETIQFCNYKDSLNKNEFYGKKMNILYNNIYDEFKGTFEINEIL